MGKLKINWLAIIAATVVAQMIGAGIYGTFADQWMDYHNLDLEFVEANQSFTPFMVSIIASIILYYVMAILFKRMNIRTVSDGLKTGLWMALAFGFLGAYTQGHFEFNVYSGMLDGANEFLGILAGALILSAWIKTEPSA